MTNQELQLLTEMINTMYRMQERLNDLNKAMMLMHRRIELLEDYRD